MPKHGLICKYLRGMWERGNIHSHNIKHFNTLTTLKSILEKVRIATAH